MEINYLEWKLVISQNIMDTHNRFLLSAVLHIMICSLHGRPYRLNEVRKLVYVASSNYLSWVLAIAMRARADKY